MTEVRHDTNTPEKTRADRRNHLRTVGRGALYLLPPVAAAAVALNVLTPGSAESTKSLPHPEAYTEQEVKAAAEAIALRYENCTIAAVEDDMAPVSELNPLYDRMTDPEQRSTVTVTVDLVDNPDAEAFLQHFEHDDHVSWEEVPGIGAVIQGKHGMQPIIGSSDINPMQKRYPGEGWVAAELHPLSTQPEGTTADLYVTQKVSYAANPDEIEYLRGVVPCGTMIFENGAWRLAESNAVTESYTVPTDAFGREI